MHLGGGAEIQESINQINNEISEIKSDLNQINKQFEVKDFAIEFNDGWNNEYTMKSIGIGNGYAIIQGLGLYYETALEPGKMYDIGTYQEYNKLSFLYEQTIASENKTKGFLHMDKGYVKYLAYDAERYVGYNEIIIIR